MSILSDFYNKNAPDKPNDVHDLPEFPQILSDAAGRSSEHAHFPTLHGANVFVSPDACGMRVPDFPDAPDTVGVPAPEFPDAPDTDGIPLPEFPDAPDTIGVPLPEFPNAPGGNDLHTPEYGDVPDKGTSLTPDARRRMQSMAEGQLHPALYYTPDQTTPSDSGVWESRSTVDAKLNDREEFPFG